MSDIIERIDKWFKHAASCRCGERMSGVHCDNHTPVWNPCPESEMILEVRALIEAQREAIAQLVEALRTAQWAMRAPLDEWKGECERKALDIARTAIEASKGTA